MANESDNAVWFDDLQIRLQEGLIVQENHYYPFGMEMVGLGKVGSPNHGFTYNGKERQEEFGLNWLDYGARFYDAQLGRWHAVDPLAEKYYPMSPYNYVLNNPILLIDPDGMEVKNGYDEELNKVKENFEANSNKFNKMANTFGVSGEIKKKDFLKKFNGDKSKWKKFNSARNSLNTSKANIDEVTEIWQDTNRLITETETHNSELFTAMDNLVDEKGNTIDVFVHSQHNFKLPGTGMEAHIAGGFSGSVAEGVNLLYKYHSNEQFQYWTSGGAPLIQFHKLGYLGHGQNSISIYLKYGTEAKWLSHEFGHAYFLFKRWNLYQRLLKQNPDWKSQKGHAKGDPQGKAAKDAENGLMPILPLKH